MIISIISFTKNGMELEKSLINILKENNQIKAYSKTQIETDTDNIIPVNKPIEKWAAEEFKTSQALIFIGACGIAVRSIAPYIKDKLTDPAVIVIDELGRNVISLLSGHMGGANELTLFIANHINANPVITTATDINNKFSVDVFAKKNSLVIENRDMIKKISSALIHNKKVGFFSPKKIEDVLPEGLVLEAQEVNIWVSPFKNSDNSFINLCPKVIQIGIGCKKNTDSEKLKSFVLATLDEYNINLKSIENIASIDLKKEETAIKDLSNLLEVPFKTYSSEELKNIDGDFTGSDYVLSITGVDNVCERAAVAASDNGNILFRKKSYDGMTLAVSERKWGIKFE